MRRREMILPEYRWPKPRGTCSHLIAGLTGDYSTLVHRLRPAHFAPRLRRSRLWGSSAAGISPCRARCRWRTTAFSSWTNCRSAGAMSSRFCVNRWRRASLEYNLPCVLDPIVLAALVARALPLTGARKPQPSPGRCARSKLAPCPSTHPIHSDVVLLPALVFVFGCNHHHYRWVTAQVVLKRARPRHVLSDRTIL
jgi:hypothetical protein